MGEIGIIIVTGILCISCFILGYKCNVKGKDIEVKLPTIKTPSQIIKDHNTKKEEDARIKEFNTNMQNIDAYDGTEFGQKDF